jgi:hypothetical protein
MSFFAKSPVTHGTATCNRLCRCDSCWIDNTAAGTVPTGGRVSFELTEVTRDETARRTRPDLTTTEVV